MLRPNKPSPSAVTMAAAHILAEVGKTCIREPYGWNEHDWKVFCRTAARAAVAMAKEVEIAMDQEDEKLINETRK